MFAHPFFIDTTRSSPLSPEDLARYEKSKALLASRGWPDLAQLPNLETDLPATHFLLRLPDGNATLLYRRDWGQQGILHHIDNPRGKVADWWAERAGERAGNCVFHGLGLGYHIPHLLEQAREGIRFLAVESDPWTFALCLALGDCKDFLCHPKIEIILPRTPIEAAERTRQWLQVEEASSVEMRFLVDPPAMVADPRFLRDWFHAFADRMPDLAPFLLKSLLDYYPKPVNLQENWAILQKRPGIGRLFGKMRGSPIVAIGAGPSLDSQLPLLRETQDRLLIIACDTAVCPLAQAGVRVDIAVAMDSSAKNHEHFQRARNIPFLPVFFGGVHPGLLKDYQDSVWVAGAEPFPTAAMLETAPLPTSYLKNKGCLVLNQTVGSTVLDLAMRLGGSPLFLAGIDLAYCGGRHHADGTIYGGSDDFKARQPDHFEIPSVDGGRVGTCTAFLVSLLGLAHQIQSSATPVYNLSPNGGLIAGALGHEEGIETLRNLPHHQGEAPSARLRAEADLALKALSRPLWRMPSSNTPIESVLDRRGRWRKPHSPGLRTALAQENLFALRQVDPSSAGRLAARLTIQETGALSHGYTCEWGETLGGGYPRLTVRDPSGNQVALLPATDSPWQEVADWGIGEAAGESKATVFLGAGMGFHLREALNHLGKSSLWVWEPQIDRLMAAMGAADFRDLFTSPSLHWSIGTSAANLFYRMSEMAPDLLASQPITWRPWVIPGIRPWAAPDESDFIETWLRLFREMRAAR